MKKSVRIILLAFAILTVNVMFAAPEDARFYGGINDGYDKNSVLDASITIPAGTIIRIF